MPNLPVVGKVPKGWLIAVGGGSVLVLGYVYYKHKQAAAGSAAASSTTPAAAGTGDQYPPDGTYGDPNDPNSTDPQTGMTYGDEALYGGGGYGTGGFGFGPGGFGFGTGGGTGTGTGTGGPPFTDNAAWATYAEQQLAAIANPTALSAALGVYLTGRPATPDQVSLIDQAIAIAGYPPVAGPGNKPPGIVQGHSSGGGGKVTVPNVVGLTVDSAVNVLHSEGLKARYSPLARGGNIVTAENPKAGTQVRKGSTVTLSHKKASR